jgi:hypothetical protein
MCAANPTSNQKYYSFPGLIGATPILSTTVALTSLSIAPAFANDKNCIGERAHERWLSRRTPQT